MMMIILLDFKKIYNKVKIKSKSHKKNNKQKIIKINSYKKINNKIIIIIKIRINN